MNKTLNSTNLTNKTNTYNPLITKEMIDQDNKIDIIEKGLDKMIINTNKINEELKNQTPYINQLDANVDRAQDKVKSVTKKTEKEMKFATCCGDWGLIPCIVFLAVVICICVILLIL